MLVWVPGWHNDVPYEIGRRLEALRLTSKFVSDEGSNRHAFEFVSDVTRVAMWPRVAKEKRSCRVVLAPSCPERSTQSGGGVVLTH